MAMMAANEIDGEKFLLVQSHSDKPSLGDAVKGIAEDEPLMELECDAGPFLPTAAALASRASRQNMHKAQKGVKDTHSTGSCRR